MGQGEVKGHGGGVPGPFLGEPFGCCRWHEAKRGETARERGKGGGGAPGTGTRGGGVTHGLSEGLNGGSGRDLHAGLLPSGYALPPGAMI